METKVKSARVLNLGKKLGLKCGVAVDSRGSSGGLALLWDEEMDITLNSMSLGHIDVLVKSKKEGDMWYLTVFYGNPVKEKRKESWRLLE